MDPLSFALFQHGFLIFFGVYITLLGYRKIGHKPGTNLKADMWSQKYGWIFRIGGPIMVVGNLLILVIRFSR
jgi:hypothetical protein